MSKHAPMWTAGMIAATALSSATSADDTTEVINGQINLGAAINVVIDGQADQTAGAQLTALGMGNAVTVDVIDRHDLENRQDFSGDVSTTARTDVGINDGTAYTTAIAQGNAASLLHDNGMDVDSVQTAADGSTVSATAEHRVESYSMYSVTTATAAANALESIAYGGETAMLLRQDSGADVTSEARALAPTGGLGNMATLAAVSSGNTVKLEGYHLGPDQSADLDQANRGAIRASAEIDAGGGAVMTTAATQAAGNSVWIQNEWGEITVEGAQDNAGTVDAETTVVLGNFDVDLVTASSEGVGNSVLISNFGENINNGVGQTNTGNVSATTRFDGGPGGVALVNATAYGNAQTSYICSECPVYANTNVTQTNSGTINANVQGSITTSGVLMGTAAAVGNTATIQAVSPYQ